ncbi:MAG: hypothetical protein HZA93_29370 [Verrucomicrobia bacterium]|nr:hypothetical protein [Verrucomicrobiota bacterium]
MKNTLYRIGLWSLLLGLWSAAFAPLPAQVVTPWADVDKTGASLADLPTRDFSHLQNKPALAPRQALVFAGTAGARVLNLPAFGPADFTFAFWLRPDALPAYSTVCYGGAGSFYAYYTAAGSIVVEKAGGGAVLATAAGTIVAGETHLWSISRTGGTTTLRKDGVAVASAADAHDYTAAVTALGWTGSTEVVVGSLAPVCFNRALSAAETLALVAQGAPHANDYNSAGASNLLPGDNSTFASAANWVVTGATTIAAGKLNLADGDICYNDLLPLIRGRPVRFAVTIDSLTAGNVQYFDGDSWVIFATTAGTYSITFSPVATYAAGLNLRASGGAAVLDNALAYRCGVLLAPAAHAPGNGLVWSDQSGNGAHLVLPTTGVVWALPDPASNVLRGSTGTNGNQQLHGAATLSANTQITRIRARALSGTPAITLGTSSGGSDLVATVTLSPAWQDLTLALAGGIVSADSSVWVGSNSTDVVQLNLALAPLTP